MAGFFLPWYHGPGFAVRGYDVGVGFILMGIGVVATGLSIYGMKSRWGWLRVLNLLAAVGGLVLGIWQGTDIAQLADLSGIAVVDFAGLGIPITLAGSIVVGASSSFSLRRKKRQRPSPVADR
ncbi:hypothetical protein ACFLTM_02855 [Candidatus Bipolaricaulota bacterium]